MGTVATQATTIPASNRIQIAVFVSCFLGVLLDGVDLMLVSVSMPYLIKDLSLTKVQAGMLGTCLMIGQGVGGILGGWLADRCGRVRVVSWSIFLFALGTALLGLTQNFWQFAAVRLISSLGIGSEWAVAFVLMGEYVTGKRRGAVLGFIGAGWSVGYVVASLLAGAVIPAYGWRCLFISMLLPVALAIYIRRRIPEPTCWLEQKRRPVQPQRKTTAEEWRIIFTEPVARKFFLLWVFASAFLAFGFYGLNNWLPTYLVTETGINFHKMTGFMVGTFLAAILGKSLIGFAADRWGRRSSYIFVTLFTALLLPFVIYFHTPGNILFLLVVTGFFVGAPYGINGTYMAESFNGRIRGTAMAGAYNVGRIGAATAPVAIGAIASKASIGLGLAVLGVAYVLTGCLALFIPSKIYDCDKK
jgi:AAHS family cis,cis-muconate transporter-like MFS transporter